MKCDELLRLLPAYPDGLDDPSARSAMEAHGAQCPACTLAMEEQLALLSTLARLDDDLLLPEGFGKNWRQAIQMEAETAKTSRFARYAALAAAAVFCVIFAGTALMRGGILFPDAGLDRQKAYQEKGVEPAGEVDVVDFVSTEGINLMSFSQGATALDETDLAQPMAGGAGEALLFAGADMEAAPMEAPMAGLADTASPQPVMRYSAMVSLVTEAYDADMAHFEEALMESGGWLSHRSEVSPPKEDSQDGGRYASLTLRIPTEALDAFLDKITGRGRVVVKEISAEDVSDSYYDTKGRLSMAEAQRERLKELLSQAEDMYEILAIDSRMEELASTIERLTGKLNDWNARADHAVVRLSIEESLPAESAGRIPRAFAKSMDAFTAFLSDAVIFLVMAAPYALGGFALCFALYLGYRLLKATTKKRSKRT